MASPDGDDGFLRSKGGGGVDTVDNGEGQSCTDSVTKGLLVKMEGDDEVSESFTYTLIRNPGRLSDVRGWLPLSPKDIPQTHIRYHEVQSKKAGLQNMITTFEAESAVAVVVVNMNNDTHLTALLTPVTKIPVVVVASSAGQKIQQIFFSQVNRCVLCKIIPRVDSTLCKGLMVKIDGGEPVSTYVYALTHNSASLLPKGIDWLPLSPTPLSQNHIRYHEVQLKGGNSDLRDTLAQGEYPTAVVLVNIDNTNDLSVAITIDRIPTIVVTASVGKLLRDVLYDSSKKTVLCKIYPIAPMAAELDVSPQQSGERSASVESVSGNDYLREVKRTLFQKGPKSPIDNVEVFKKAMSLLSAYELLPVEERGKEHCLQPARLYRKLIKRIEKFHSLKDFIFHFFIMVHRFCLTYMLDTYQRDGTMVAEIKRFSIYLTDSLKTFHHKEIVATVNRFMKRGPYVVEMTMPHPTPVVYKLDVFTLCAQACLMFSKETDAIELKMILISIYLKMVQMLKLSTDPLGVWRTGLIQAISSDTLNNDAIKELKSGLNFTKCLELPMTLRFNEQLMADFFLGEEKTRISIRPFRLLKMFLQSITPYLTEGIAFLANIIHPVRVSYKCLLTDHSEKRRVLLRSLSEDNENPEISAVTQVLCVLEEVMNIINQKNWDDMEFEKEIRTWLTFLLSLVDIADVSANECFRQFFSGEYRCCVEHHKFIKKEVIAKVEENFRSLHVDLFYPIYKSHSFWSIETLTAYFTGYDIEGFGLKLSQGWQLLLREFCIRHKEVHAHGFLLGFMKSAADWYSSDCSPDIFFLDLLKLDVPSLFFNEKSDLKDLSSLCSQFSCFLQGYYKRMRKHCNFAIIMKQILENVSDGYSNHFQDTVLQIISMATVDETLLCHEDNQAENAFEFIINSIAVSSTFFTNPSRKHVFCWNVVEKLCLRMPSLEHLKHFPRHYKGIMKLCGYLYVQYCDRKGNSTDVIKTELPKDLPTLLPQTRAFFEWTRKIHQHMQGWKYKLQEKRINYGEMIIYKGWYSDLKDLMKAFHSEDHVFDRQELETLVAEFNGTSDKVSNILIQRMPDLDSQKVLWCSLISVLTEYGLEIPCQITDALHRHVQYPEGEEGILYTSPTHPFYPSTQSIDTEIKESTSLGELCDFHQCLISFLQPLQRADLQLLLFFRLHNSVLFDKYLRLQIRAELEGSSAKSPTKTTSVTIPILQVAVKNTKYTLCSLIEGKAKYKDIKSVGAVELENMNTELEFSILEKAVRTLHLTVESESGLKGIRCILELLKASSYIETLSNIFQRYKLKSCTEDKHFLGLKDIQASVNDQLTPNIATEKLGHVRDILKIPENDPIDCLGFLNDIYEGEQFHKFLSVRRFYGDQGHRAFRQQYELITAQLQNKTSSYEEKILNQLLPAFQFLSPFISTTDDVSFNTLVEAMWKLDRYNGPIQLRNICRHINLVVQWFAQVQGDTAKSIETELKDVMSTGIFEISSEAALKLAFQRSTGESGSESSSYDLSCTWHEKEIIEFVTRVGFLSNKLSCEEMAKQFLCLHEVACKSFHLIQKIKQFGEGVSIQLLCSMTTEEANVELETLQDKFSKGRDMVSHLQNKYRWLYFIPGRLVSKLFKLLTSKPPLIDEVVTEVTYLFSHEFDMMKLRDSCSKQLGTGKIQHSAQEVQLTAFTSVEYIGRFLDIIFEDVLAEVPTQVLATPKPGGLHYLHYAPGYNQDLLMDLLLATYKGGIPQSFQVFRCHEMSTEEEISFFFQKVEGFLSTYTILEVNRLTMPLQQYIMERIVNTAKECNGSVVHLVETKPSVLHDVFDFKEHDVSGVQMQEEQGLCTKGKALLKDYVSVKIVCGIPGDGKTHHILDILRQTCSVYVTIPIHEGFSYQQVIKRLRALPLNSETSKVYGVFLNFTMCYQKEYDQLFNMIGWFFFELLVLGAVIDYESATTFRLHNKATWHFYIEIPSSHSSESSLTVAHQLERNLLEFQERLPIFKYIGQKVVIGSRNNFDIDCELQLVCKHLRAYENRRRSYDIGTFNRRPRRTNPNPQGEVHLPAQECLELLRRYLPPHASRKISQMMFVKYMYRRCIFLEQLPNLKYNLGVEKISGDHCSTFVGLMLEEVAAFINPRTQGPWSKSIPLQLIYGMDHEEISIDIITSSPGKIKLEHKEVLGGIGIEVPSERSLQSLDYLVQCLCKSLQIPRDDCTKLLAEEKYVLTLDYTLKMLNIHERRQCGVPVIIEGETGVGKTALIEMLSKLWNISQRNQIFSQRKHFLDYIKEKLNEHQHSDPESYGKALEIIRSCHDCCHTDGIRFIAKLPVEGRESMQFFTFLRDYILKIKANSCIFMEHHKELFNDFNHCGTLETTVLIADAILNSEMRNLFYKLSIHSALTPEHINDFFEDILQRAKDLQQVCSSPDIRTPTIVVFLDELNTSSCGGVLKEIIVDRSLFGKLIPHNIFVIGACNPHRGNSVCLLEESTPDLWSRSTYYVRPLHPTLRFLVWDYGALDLNEEKEYVLAKMKMIEELTLFKCSDGSDIYEQLTNLIVNSQEEMRKNVLHFIKKNIDEDSDHSIADRASKSCVSQRDIQRVFTFYNWFLQLYSKFSPHGCYQEKQNEYQRRAVLVSLAIVYYLRQPVLYRKKYEKMIESTNFSEGISFSQAFNDDLDWMMGQIKGSIDKNADHSLPPGIAMTSALRENIFAMIACICTKTPLIIVGEPGSSKTLSFHIVAENLRGHESVSSTFKYDTNIFPSIDPYFHQCSRHTTSNDIKTVFERAKVRQETVISSVENKTCVVFLDEAGLPEESLESLKALHYYLDESSVAFVGISNHVLDAAKTNRCVSVVRMKTSKEELEMLARGCLSDVVPFDLERVVKFCCNYLNLMKEEEYKNFFGLRDFIHFLQYLQCSHREISSGKLVLKAIERNFNGKLSFRKLVLKLMDGVVEGNAEHIVRENSRSIVEVLQDSLSECPSGTSPENTVRYKLIIDPSKDNSLIRYLFKFGVVKKENTRMFMRSDAFNDEEAQKVTTVSAICHSVTEGHTVILSQTDDIHESFYDLYNFRYRFIDDPGKGRLFYANVAIGAYIKPCPVNAHFQCIVLCHEDDIGDMPAPFLNRFEKYHITYDTMLESAMKKLPRGWCSLMEAVRRKVEEFAVSVEGSVSIYGYCKETSASLLLWFLPSTPNLKGSNEKYFLDHSTEREQFLLELVVNMLRDVGFHIPHISNEEIKLDIMSLFRILRFNVAFAEYIERLTDHSVMVAISEALEVLNSQSCYQNRDLSVGACLMISLILQWAVRHLCKALMQVMTPEGIVAFHKKIPSSYVLNYLENQAHFSLEKLIFCQNRALQNNSGPTCTKFLVHCRTSDLIMDLPFNDFRHHLLMVSNFSQSSPPAEERVTFLSMSKCHTEGVFLERLHDFYSSKELCIFILKVNMQETSLKAINHIRMMIEDVENQNSTQTKIAVVLLHFPSSMFSEGTYPSLFQEGWSHHYLDSVSMSREPHTVNTEQWIKQCCLSSDCVMKAISTSLQQLTRKSIPLVIPLLASKLKFCKGKDTNARKQMYTELLIDKEFGELLCIKFQDYWKPPLLAAFLEKAAAIIFRRESSVSMTSLIQNLVHSKFSEFVMYMVSEMMETNSRDLLLGPDCPTLISRILKEIVCTMDLIEFSQLARQNVLKQKRSQYFKINRWAFPFYIMLSKTVDDLIEECEREVKRESICFEETDSPDIVLPSEIKLTSIVKDHIHQIMDVQNQPMKRNWRSLAVALKFVDKHECLLERYFCHFISDKLSIVCVSNGVVFDVFKEYFNNLAHCVETHHESDCEHAISRRVMKLIMFHISFRYHPDSLAGIFPILKQLAEVQLLTKFNDASVTTTDLTVYRDNALSLLSDPKCLCAYITDLVFSAIVTLWMKNKNSAQWFVFYQNMVTNHRVKMILYKYMTPSEEGKLNAMHTAYVILHCDISDGKLKGQSNAVFWTLYAKFFKDLELKDVKRWPQLKDCASVTLKYLECSQKETVYVVLHGLLDHFFSEHRSRFHSEDVNWFLELASEKIEWKRQYIRIFTDNASDGIPFGVIKHHLLRVMTHEKIVDGRKVHFAGFNKQYRSAVGDALSMFENDISVQYSPYFYFEAPYPELPLAHIYFLIVLETLLGNTTLSQYNVKELISTVMKDVSSPEEHYVCTIEQQALLQKLLQQIAEAQASGRLGYTLSTMQFDSLMSEVSSSDMLPEHGTVIAMHLLHQSRNLSKLRQHMEHLYKNGVGCLGSHIDRLKTQPVVRTDPKLIRLMESKHLCDMYMKVCKAMKQFQRTGSDDDAKKLLHGTYIKWSESMLHLLPGKIRINNKDCLKMMMWLVAYHQFYLEKIPFPELINAVKTEKFMDATQVKLFEVLLGGFKPESCHSTLLDEIFYPRSITCQDQTHMEMRDCIVNIIAIVFGSPSGSNHLWYHLMEPKTLDGTFLTGFMYSQSACSKNGSFYKDGTNLTDSGFYGKYAYTADRDNRPLCLPSLYVLLWINFATFGMALFTKSSTKEDMSFLCPNAESPTTLCSKRLQSLWTHMTTNMDMCDEYVSDLITNCLTALLKESCDATVNMSGIFHESKKQIEYEKKWEEKLFCPIYCRVSQEVSVDLSKMPVLKDIMHMRKRFPQLLSYNDVAYMLYSTPVCQMDLMVLSQFVLEFPRLCVGSSLLPDLIRLYQWLHRELSHSVTKQAASKLTLAMIIKQLTEKKSDELIALLKRVIGNYNKYVRYTGKHTVAQKENRQCLMNEKTTLFDLVSSEVLENATGKDCIFQVIDDIITSHTRLLKCMSKAATHLNGLEKYTLLPCSTLHPSLLSPSDCIICSGDVDTEDNNLKLLMRKWSYFLPPADYSSSTDLNTMTAGGRMKLNTLRIQEGVLEMYLAGKPMIESAKTLYTSFSFVPQPGTSNEYSHQELMHLRGQLSQPFCESLSKPEKTVLDYEFHSASFELYQGLISSLTTAVYILVNEINEGKGSVDPHQCLCTFLRIEEENDDFFEKENESYRMSKSQEAHIKGVKLCHLYSTLEMLMKWNDSGVHDFHMLPYAMKRRMSDEDEAIILSCQAREYKGRNVEFLRDLKFLEGSLVHLEPQLMKNIDIIPQTSINSLLDKEQTCLAKYIPDGVQIHHYVSLRLVTRRLMLLCQTAKPPCDTGACDEWQENDPEPWKHFHCTLQARWDYANPLDGHTKQNYGFETKTVTEIETTGFDCVSESSTTSTYAEEFMSLDVDMCLAQMAELQVDPEAEIDNKEVCKLLVAIGLSECVDWAKAEVITRNDLMGSDNDGLTDENIKDLQLKNSFHRLKLIVNLERLKNYERRHSSLALSYPPREIARFLSSIGHQYEKYSQLFLDNGVDGEILDRASSEALKDLGVPSAVDRALIMHRFCALINGPSELSARFPPEKVYDEVLKLGLEEVAIFVKEHGIDGELIANANDELREEMGIKAGHFRKLRNKCK